MYVFFFGTSRISRFVAKPLSTRVASRTSPTFLARNRSSSRENGSSPSPLSLRPWTNRDLTAKRHLALRDLHRGGRVARTGRVGKKNVSRKHRRRSLLKRLVLGRDRRSRPPSTYPKKIDAKYRHAGHTRRTYKRNSRASGLKMSSYATVASRVDLSAPLELGLCDLCEAFEL